MNGLEKVKGAEAKKGQKDGWQLTVTTFFTFLTQKSAECGEQFCF